MYRLLPFLLILSLIAFAPAVLTAQDKDKDKAADKDKVADKDKATDKDKAEEKKDKDKAEEKKPPEKTPPPTPVAKEGGEETVIWYKKGIYQVGEFAKEWAPIAFGALICILLMGLRGDLNRMEEKMDKAGGGGGGQA